MRIVLSALMVALALSVNVPGASALDQIAEEVKKGCKTELETHCKPVTPGNGRLLACLYSYGDKLSGGCEYALYDAAVQLERAVAALTYVANECMDDAEKHCASVPVGEGRIIECLKKNDGKLDARCKQALTDVGL
jgi:hypothetical protein